MTKSPGPEAAKHSSPLAGAEIAPSRQALDQRKAAGQDSTPDLLASTLATSVRVERKPAKPLLSQLRSFKEQRSNLNGPELQAKKGAVAPNPSLAQLRRQLEQRPTDEADYAPNIIDKLISFLAAILKKIEINVVGVLNQRRRNIKSSGRAEPALKPKKSAESSGPKVKRS